MKIANYYIKKAKEKLDIDSDAKLALKLGVLPSMITNPKNRGVRMNYRVCEKMNRIAFGIDDERIDAFMFMAILFDKEGTDERQPTLNFLEKSAPDLFKEIKKLK